MSKKRVIFNWIALILLAATATVTLVEIRSDVEQPDPLGKPYFAIYFWQEGCPACREMGPTIDKLEEKYADRLTIVRSDAQSAAGKDLAEFNRVQYAPALVLVKSETGKEVARWVGARTPGEIAQVLDDLQ